MASAVPQERYKLIFFVPTSHLSQCKTAVFSAGAGRYPGPGNYSEAGFTILGTAQFRPGMNANPAIGTKGELEEVEEARFETIVVGREVVKAAVQALLEAHPYEEVAYEVYKFEDF